MVPGVPHKETKRTKIDKSEPWIVLIFKSFINRCWRCRSSVWRNKTCYFGNKPCYQWSPPQVAAGKGTEAWPATGWWLASYSVRVSSMSVTLYGRTKSVRTVRKVKKNADLF